MVFRYLSYLIFQRFLMGFIGNIFIFPISWLFREKLTSGFFWWWLHDGNWYGDEYFLNKYKNKKTFWTAWMWAFRNPIHNFYYSRKIEGDITDYKGSVTCHRPDSDSGKEWRTLLTEDEQGVFQHKYGKWICTQQSILGWQTISFRINGKKYFKFSVARPFKIRKNLYWVPEIKIGFERTYWAEQLHLFKFKRYNGKFSYSKIDLK